MKQLKLLLLIVSTLVGLSFVTSTRAEAACSDVQVGSTATSRTIRVRSTQSGNAAPGTIEPESCPIVAPNVPGYTLSSAQLGSLNDFGCVPAGFEATGYSATSQGTNFSKYVDRCGNSSSYAVIDDSAIITLGGRTICMGRTSTSCASDAQDYNAASSATDAGAVRSIGFIDGINNDVGGPTFNPAAGSSLTISGGGMTVNFSTKQQYTGGFYSSVAVRFNYTPIPPPNVTITGRVFRHPSQAGSGGLAGISIYNCHTTITTNASGVFTFTLPQDTGYCLRITSGQPSNTTGDDRNRPQSQPYGQGTFNPPNNCPAFTASTATPLVNGQNFCVDAINHYEWQVAGRNAHTNCGSNSVCGLDRSIDTGFDFIYQDFSPNPTITNFSVSCETGVTLTVNTSGNADWVARLYVDGVATTGPTGRIPDPGSARSGETVNKTISSWFDVRSHTFSVRVDDQSDPSNLRTTSSSVTVGPCVEMTCNSPPTTLSFNPNPSQPGQAFEMSLTVGFRQTFGANAIVNDITPSFNHTVSYDAPAFAPPNASMAGGNTSKYVTTFSGIIAPAGSHSGTITVNASGGASMTCTFGRNGSNPCVAKNPATGVCDLNGQSTESQPFIQAYRGDVRAGEPIYESGSCVNSGGGTVRTYNQGSSGGHRGSSSQLGVLARGSVTQFISASLRAVAPSKPNGLTFANNPSPGDYAHLRQSCIDYFSGHNPNPPATNTDANFAFAALPAAFGADKVISHNGNLNIPGYGTFRGDLTAYVDGNLTITGNVGYNVPAGGYASIADIPNVRFIVRGDIFINPGVSELHGTYIAMPRDAATGGSIYTCAPLIPGAAPSYAELKSVCTSAPTLKFFGSVVAKKIHLHRLTGTSNNAGVNDDYGATTSGEAFIESPLHWIVLPQSSTSGGGSTKYESINKLPPVL